MEKELVNFIGIGVPKAGTTWLFSCLSEHPEICTSKAKEIDYFFDDNYTKGEEWYFSHFSHCKENQIKGEFSPTYIYNQDALSRIKGDFPEVKLIIVLRDPSERFLSAFYFEHAMGRHTENLESIEDPKLERNLTRGRYSLYIENVHKLFPKERVLILFQEDIEQNPTSILRKVFSFLGVNTSFTPPSIQARKNVTNPERTRIKWIKNLYYKAYRFFSKTPLRPLLQKMRVGKVARFLLSFNDRDSLPPAEKKITSSLKKELEEYYREEYEFLEKLKSEVSQQ